MLGPVARISNQFGRNVMKSNVRHSSLNGGIPGENLPFNMHNKNMLTFNLFWYVGTGLALPFLVVWQQLAKKG